MPSSSTALIDRSTAALRAGDRQLATALLAQAVAADPANEQGWLLLSGALETAEQRRYCLQRALAIAQDNEAALRGLRAIEGERTPQSTPIIAPELDSDAAVNAPTSAVASVPAVSDLTHRLAAAQRRRESDPSVRRRESSPDLSDLRRAISDPSIAVETVAPDTRGIAEPTPSITSAPAAIPELATIVAPIGGRRRQIAPPPIALHAIVLTDPVLEELVPASEEEIARRKLAQILTRAHGERCSPQLRRIKHAHRLHPATIMRRMGTLAGWSALSTLLFALLIRL